MHQRWQSEGANPKKRIEAFVAEYSVEAFVAKVGVHASDTSTLSRHSMGQEGVAAEVFCIKEALWVMAEAPVDVFSVNDSVKAWSASRGWWTWI